MKSDWVMCFESPRHTESDLPCGLRRGKHRLPTVCCRAATALLPALQSPKRGRQRPQVRALDSRGRSRPRLRRLSPWHVQNGRPRLPRPKSCGRRKAAVRRALHRESTTTRERRECREDRAAVPQARMSGGAGRENEMLDRVIAPQSRFHSRSVTECRPERAGDPPSLRWCQLRVRVRVLAEVRSARVVIARRTAPTDSLQSCVPSGTMVR